MAYSLKLDSGGNLQINGGPSIGSAHFSKILALLLAQATGSTFANDSQIYDIQVDDQNNRVTWRDANINGGADVQSVNYDSSLISLVQSAIAASAGVSLAQIASLISGAVTDINAHTDAAVATVPTLLDTPLASAVNNGVSAVGDLIVSAKADINGHTTDAIAGQTPLFTAEEKQAILALPDTLMPASAEETAFSNLGREVGNISEAINALARAEAEHSSSSDHAITGRLVQLEAMVAWSLLPETRAGSGRTRGLKRYITVYRDERPSDEEQENGIRIYNADNRQQFISTVHAERMKQRKDTASVADLRRELRGGEDD